MASAVGCIDTYYSSFSQSFSLADPFWLRKITKDPHIIFHVHIVSQEDRFSKLIMYISEVISDRLKNTSSIRKNAMYNNNNNNNNNNNIETR